MTAVAPPPNFQSIPRTGWSAANGAPNGLNTMSADEVTRMFMPRKSAQRSNSSSSIASSASSTSTISASSTQTGSAAASGAANQNGWESRRKPTRSLWPASKAEPIAGLSTARPQSVATSSSGPSAASAISALHTPSSMLPSQHAGQSQVQQNGVSRAQPQSENTAVLYLLPMNGTFERKTITVPFYPDVLRIGRQTNNKTIPTPLNGYFDSKVLSRQHAEVWADRNGKIWIRDVKSSNGTFVNGQRLSQENKDSDPHELRDQDMLELGIDIVSEDQKTVVHHKVAARVEHAGFYNSNSVLDINFGDLDPSVNGGLMGQPLQNMAPLRGRSGSQGSVGSNGRLGSAPASAAGNNINGAGQRHMPFWLSPITMDQVVKKIINETKLAKQQSQDLQRATQYIDALLANEPKKEPKAPNHPAPKPSPIKNDIKARFSDPPAPPPQQPLPEKPDAARLALDTGIQPPLRRTDTERPRLVSVNSSPVKTDTSHQITSLVDALAAAKKELDSQNVKLKDLEGLLAQERSARESAEERAQRLELERRDSAAKTMNDQQTDGAVEGSENPLTPIEDDVKDDGQPPESSTADAAAATRLQERLNTLLAEMNEMKQQMETYKRRAEAAEEESARDRKSLAEMVERIRQDDADRMARETSTKRRRSSGSEKRPSQGLDGAEADGEVVVPNGSTVEKDVTALFKKAGIENGRPVTPEQVEKLEKEVSQALATRTGKSDHMAQTAPFAAMLAVVIIGIGLMTRLNGWSKAET